MKKERKLQNSTSERMQIPWKKIIVIFLTIMLISIVGISFVLNGVNGIKGVFIVKNALENTYYIIQIIGGCALIIGAVIGIWQYVLTARCERTKLNMEKVEKAVELAEYYKNEILPIYVAIKYVFDKGGVKSELEKIKSSDMKVFSDDELKVILSEADKKKMEGVIKGKETVQAIKKADLIFNLGLNLEQTAGNDEEVLIKLFMSNVINKVLNSMEYLAMNFVHGVADETVVYQSLSRTYIEIVQLLYYNIAVNNIPGKQRLFTNLTELYRRWNSRYLDEKKKKDEINTGTVVDTKID